MNIQEELAVSGVFSRDPNEKGGLEASQKEQICLDLFTATNFYIN